MIQFLFKVSGNLPMQNEVHPERRINLLEALRLFVSGSHVKISSWKVGSYEGAGAEMIPGQYRS